LAGKSWSQDLNGIIPSCDFVFSDRGMAFLRYSRFDNSVHEVRYIAPAVGGLDYLSSPVENASGEEPNLRMVSDVLDVTFWYSTPAEPLEWLQTWEVATNLPAAVQMRIASADGKEVTRTVMFLYAKAGEEDASQVQ
jgi:hypothetical protein